MMRFVHLLLQAVTFEVPFDEGAMGCMSQEQFLASTDPQAHQERVKRALAQQRKATASGARGTLLCFSTGLHMHHIAVALLCCTCHPLEDRMHRNLVTNVIFTQLLIVLKELREGVRICIFLSPCS